MRHYLDGQPYYCVTCGLALSEYMSCEKIGCQLEGKEEAMRRREKFMAGASEDKRVEIDNLFSRKIKRK